MYELQATVEDALMGGFVAIDTGGTFTDLVAFDPDAQRIVYTKSLTTHSNPLDGIMDCVAKTRLSLESTALFKHGTTLVVNTLIERSGPQIVLVTTRGFRDVLDLGRGNRSEQYDLFFRRDPALVSRVFRLELDERIGGQGQILIPPRRDDVVALAQRIRSLNAAAVAICFLNSYLEPSNETMVAGWLREFLPDIFITASTELSREWYEFERTSTAAANAYTGPKVSTYVRALDNALAERKFRGQFLIMGSNGGMLSPDAAMLAPVTLVESGPIGGCIGAGVYGQKLGITNLIAFDMGGTTAKCALVREGSFDVVSTYYLGGYGRGLPIRTPVIDIVEVGAGGGSIAWLDTQSRLHVGPRSAGSTPGPICYGHGGSEPTVTDANLVLGRLNPLRFQGGEMLLNEDAAQQAIDELLAKPLGYSGQNGALDVASGIVDLAIVIMSGAIKRITVERGKDPRDFVLFAYGGGGPLHAVDLARELSIPQVVIPPEPGNFSAIGMLLAKIRSDTARTFVAQLSDNSLQGMSAVFDEMTGQLRKSLKETFGDIPIAFERSAEMRFVGQLHTVRVAIERDDIASLEMAFSKTYLARYGHLIRGGRVELVSLHAAAFADTPQPDLASIFRQPEIDPDTVSTTRAIYDARLRRTIQTRVFSRTALPAGFKSTGPAVIEEYGSTTVVGPGDRFEIGSLGEIRIEVGQQYAGMDQ
jgi:N-methylhydantoinase A